MYILKNSLLSIFRNKGRNILIGIIILVITSASTVTLAIRNTANKIVQEYKNSHDLIATISLNRKEITKSFERGEEAQKTNIEKFNAIEQLSIENIKNYGDSNYLKSYYYVYTTSLNSDSLSKATDKYQYEVENRETKTETTTQTSGNRPQMPGGNFDFSKITNKNTTITITKSMETFQSNRNLTGDFKIEGYSSYDAMTNFIEGTYKIVSGEMISNFNEFECVISSELATLNNIEVNDVVKFKNSNTDKEYEFVVKGIYTDSTDEGDSSSMYSKSANTIITSSNIVEQIVSDDDSISTSITPSFVLKDESIIENFKQELLDKGLDSSYVVSTNLDDLNNATKSIENVKVFASTFLLITLLISSIVLFIINMINIRERKYEIGVYRTIGMSKFKLSLQFILELILVATIALIIGAVIGSFISKPVGNLLLSNELNSNANAVQEISDNFGKIPMNINFNGVSKLDKIESMDAIVNFEVIIQLLGVGLLLTLVSSLASMISIQRFSPLSILKERS